jgi:hypothetical protein
MVEIMGRGTILFQCKNEEHRALIFFYFVPSLKSNTISFKQKAQRARLWINKALNRPGIQHTSSTHTHAHRWGYQLTIPAQGRAKRLLHKKRTTTLNKELEALGSSSRTNEEQRKPPANTTGIPTNWLSKCRRQAHVTTEWEARERRTPSVFCIEHILTG